MDHLIALNRWLRPLAPGRAALLWGGSLRPLAAAAAAWGAVRSAGVLVLDAANVFDPYQLLREARLRGLSRHEALHRVRVARAFTCHQLVRLAAEELAPALAPGHLVLVLGPATLFYDEQIPLPERRRLCRLLTATLAAVKTTNPLLLLQPHRPQGAANRGFGRILAPLVDVFGEVQGIERGGQGSRTPAPSLKLPPPTP
ncbi:MAG: hypothetical protein FJ128_14620 [Deltaproteobacteria bacterium]|nr:hypothetical protein [Deltaproteobacteria bacterium]